MSILRALAGLCGGDDGEDAQAPRPLIDPARRLQRLRECEFGYFYSDAAQMIETAGCVTFAHIPSADAYGLTLMRAAVDAGISRLIVSVGNCGFEAADGRRVYRGIKETQGSLWAFFTDAAAAGLLTKVVGLMGPDEPNLPELPIEDGDLRSFCADLTYTCEQFAIDPLRWIIYSGNNDDTPAIDLHDCIARDKYGDGIGAAGWRPALRAGQKRLLVPACAKSKPGDPSPWAEHPQPWIDAMVEDDDCAGIMAFDYCGYEGIYPGLRDGDPELRRAWLDAGREIVNAQET